MYKEFNANPISRRGNDCTVRAICKTLHKEWEEVYIDLCLYGLRLYDMPSSNHVWGMYLADHGYTRHIIPDTCPTCYTVSAFTHDHPKGHYILALHGHVVSCINGDYYDSWDSGDEVPIYYWQKGND